MSFAINVSGGTGAGVRKVRVLADWTCSCSVDDPLVRYIERTHPGDVYSCPDCGDRRPAVTRIGLEREGWDVPPDAA